MNEYIKMNEWMNRKDDKNIITVIKLQLGKMQKTVKTKTFASLFPLFPSFTATGIYI
jgi:hypothetical protein